MKKEYFEWIKSWCDKTTEKDLPRVLLVGDSITDGYQAKVRELLSGVCYVDYIATSYAIDSPMYVQLVKNFVKDSDYALVHFNHGLHGLHIPTRTYKSLMRKLSDWMLQRTKVVFALSTHVMAEGSKRSSGRWMKIVRPRNKAVLSLAATKNCAVDDLFTVSTTLKERTEDGVHFMPEGYAVLAAKVAESIQAALNQ
ncbi:MAG: hypothetical protein IJV85_04615 [Clostridia bacterium]|nr:hypothetical protein [Clostridia bacterium]